MLKTIEQKVLKFIDENHLIEKNDNILLALSGGADSVFLFHFLLKFKRRLGIRFSSFHLNHEIRGKEAIEDELFCRNLCEAKNIKCFTVSRNVKYYAKKEKLSVEEAGRNLRYEELKRIADVESFDKISTAHTASDNTETFILNLVKGTGLKGLSGIPVRREQIIRPLLILTADEVRNYLKVMEIVYRMDTSNIGIDYERNFLRNEIIPKLKKLNPKVEEKVFNSSGIIRDIRIFIDKQITGATLGIVKFANDTVRINLNKLKNLDKVLWQEFLKSVIENNFDIDLSSENLNSIMKLIEYQSGKKLKLPDGIEALKEREYLLINRTKPATEKPIRKSLKINDKVKVNRHWLHIEKIPAGKKMRSSKKSVEFISADGIRREFQLRRWKEGDRFYPLGMKGSKKISDFLIDEKISSLKKKEQLVLLNAGKIVWVVGLRIDDRFKLTPNTKKVIRLSYK